VSGFLDEPEALERELVRIDGAHCISEWDTTSVRNTDDFHAARKFPEVRLMAATATATERVVATSSSNCTCASRAVTLQVSTVQSDLSCLGQDRAYDQDSLLHPRPSREGGIIYCQARKTTEDLAQKAFRDG